MTKQQEIKVGIKLDMGKGPQLFGADQVNRLLALGWRVAELRQGGVIFSKYEDAGRPVQLLLSGCDMVVVMTIESSTD